MNEPKWHQRFGHLLPHLQTLAAGARFGAVAPDGNEPETWARQLRHFLNFHHELMYSRWSVRLRSDGVVVICKVGHWGNIWQGIPAETYEPAAPPKPPKPCECGCGRTTRIATCSDKTRGWIAGEHVRFIQGHHNKVRKKTMAVCPGCGNIFQIHQKGKGQRCCSRGCASQFKIMRNAQRPDTPATLRARGFIRKRCDVCRELFWCKPYLKRQSCSVKCKQIKIGRRRRTQISREEMYELFMIQKLSYAAINKRFGHHPYSLWAYRACREFGFPRRIRGARNNPPKDLRKVAAMYESGMSLEQIARSFPCSPTHILNLLKRAGVPTRKRYRRQENTSPDRSHYSEEGTASVASRR